MKSLCKGDKKFGQTAVKWFEDAEVKPCVLVCVRQSTLSQGERWLDRWCWLLWSPSLTVVVARQQYGRRHSLAQESRTRSSSLEHRSLITAFACRSLLSLEDESVLESDHTVVSECLESNNNEELQHW